MTWTGGEARPGHRLGGTQRLTSPRGGGVLETSSSQDPGDEEHVAVRGNQLNRARPLIPRTKQRGGRGSLRTQTTVLSTRLAVRAGERRATTG